MSDILVSSGLCVSEKFGTLTSGPSQTGDDEITAPSGRTGAVVIKAVKAREAKFY
jgi:hypothetical protein